jgi:hypothetical protein
MFDFDPQSSGCIQAVVRRADRGAVEISSGATKERQSTGCKQNYVLVKICFDKEIRRHGIQYMNARNDR